MNIREAELPGIGKKFQADTRNGERLVVVIHDDGRRELYFFEKDSRDESSATLELNDEEARQLAGILGGLTYTPRALEKVEMVLDELALEWYRVEPDSAAAGRTIGDLDVRQRFGAVVVAIIGSDKKTKTINPGPETTIEAGATLIVVGSREQVRRLRSVLVAGGGE
ncbi:K(+)/H(+) antiporter subunit KhtT [Rubrobacter xylanophilus DSM 9941]|uniref:cation:proton antiporter regulatory subunit n=1 Tax=Rubrobacter xylanophilus TaxID=49319 RepID=UPI001C6419E2|nr:cation:proton antiporter regulatory subunit [Rubrobacter xylanophilus]QYJ14576.1 K(+)/H(+) antiporter subunit KhtT [Rubrobacter xylanophilus DSM 9941]